MKLNDVISEIKQTDASLTESLSLAAIACVESEGNMQAIGEAGEIGPFQVHPVHNPKAGASNVLIALDLLRKAKLDNATWFGAFMHYNCGHKLSELKAINVKYGTKCSIALYSMLRIARNKVTGHIDLDVLSTYDPSTDPVYSKMILAINDDSLPKLSVVDEKTRVIDLTKLSKDVPNKKNWNSFNSGSGLSELLKF